MKKETRSMFLWNIEGMKRLTTNGGEGAIIKFIIRADNVKEALKKGRAKVTDILGEQSSITVMPLHSIQIED